MVDSQNDFLQTSGQFPRDSQLFACQAADPGENWVLGCDEWWKDNSPRAEPEAILDMHPVREALFIGNRIAYILFLSGGSRGNKSESTRARRVSRSTREQPSDRAALYGIDTQGETSQWSLQLCEVLTCHSETRRALHTRRRVRAFSNANDTRN